MHFYECQIPDTIPYFSVLTDHEDLPHGDDLGAAEHVGHDLGDHGRPHATRVHHSAVAGLQDGLALQTWELL